jgi:hypothetical protein
VANLDPAARLRTIAFTLLTPRDAQLCWRRGHHAAAATDDRAATNAKAHLDSRFDYEAEATPAWPHQRDAATRPALATLLLPVQAIAAAALGPTL